MALSSAICPRCTVIHNNNIYKGHIIMTKTLVIVLRDVRASSSPYTVTLLSYNIAPRNWRKKTNKILNSIMSLWKTSLNRNFFSWKQQYAKPRREWWGTWIFSAQIFQSFMSFPLHYVSGWFLITVSAYFQAEKVTNWRLVWMYY